MEKKKKEEKEKEKKRKERKPFSIPTWGFLRKKETYLKPLMEKKKKKLEDP